MNIESIFLHAALFIMTGIATYQYIKNRARRDEYQTDQETLQAIYDILHKVSHAGHYDPFIGSLHYNHVYERALNVRDMVVNLKATNEQLEKENIRLRQLEAEVKPLESVDDYQRKITALTLQLEEMMHADIDEIGIKPFTNYRGEILRSVESRGYQIHMVIDGREITSKE